MPIAESNLKTTALLVVCALVLSACSTRAPREITTGSAAGMIGDTLPSAVVAAPQSAVARSTSPAREQLAVLEQLALLGGKPIEELTPTLARQQPSPADAVVALLKKESRPVEKEAVANVVDRTIPGPGGTLPIRVYTPSGTGPFPLVVYYHGGGFVIANLDTYDASARALTNAARAVVVSVQYRKAPEHPFPAAHDDALAAYAWVLKNGAQFSGDVSRVALAGESAGGNLAVATAIGARDQQMQRPSAVLSVYPIAGTATNTESYERHAAAKPLNRPMMQWFFRHYLSKPSDQQDVRVNLLSADLKDLPPTTIIAAEFDPLHSDGVMLTDRLRAAGVKVQYQSFNGVSHEFFGQGAVVPSALTAVEYAAQALRTAFGSP